VLHRWKEKKNRTSPCYKKMGTDLSSFSMMKAISHVMISSVTRLRKSI